LPGTGGSGSWERSGLSGTGGPCECSGSSARRRGGADVLRFSATKRLRSGSAGGGSRGSLTRLVAVSTSCGWFVSVSGVTAVRAGSGRDAVRRRSRRKGRARTGASGRWGATVGSVRS
jgi:hypothetical protein